MLFNDYIVYTYSLEQSLLLCSSFIIRFLFLLCLTSYLYSYFVLHLSHFICAAFYIYYILLILIISHLPYSSLTLHCIYYILHLPYVTRNIFLHYIHRTLTIYRVLTNKLF